RRPGLRTRLVRISVVGAIVLALFTIAAVVSRRFTKLPSITVVNRDPIKRMTLPPGWTSIRIGDVPGRSLSQQVEYCPPGQPEVGFQIDDLAGAPESQEAEALKTVLIGQPGSIDESRIPSTIASVGANKCQGGPSEVSKAWTEDVKGKRVLIVESHCG